MHLGHLHCDLWQTEFSTRILIDFFMKGYTQHLFPGCQWVLDILLMIVVSRVDVNKFLNHDKKIFLKLFFWTISHMRPKSMWCVTLTKIRARPQTLWRVTGRIGNGTVLYEALHQGGAREKKTDLGSFFFFSTMEAGLTYYVIKHVSKQENITSFTRALPASLCLARCAEPFSWPYFQLWAL